MLVAHIDDSGSQGEGPVFVLAGYVADVNQWKRFSDQWQMALDMRPKLKRLKIQEALRLEELWGRTKPKDRDDRMKRFASIIHRHVRFGVVASIGWDDLRKLRRFNPPGQKYAPYLLLYHQLMSRVTDWVFEHKLADKIHFVFDEQGKLGKIAPASFLSMPADTAPELVQMVAGAPNHGSDEEILPLQAAHTIAWLVRRYAHENNLTGDLSGWKLTQPYLKKLRKIDMLWTWSNYEKLSERFRKNYEVSTQSRNVRFCAR